MLPGFGPALGFTLFYVSLVVLIPLAALISRPWEHGLDGAWKAVTDPRVVAALRLSFTVSALAAATNVVAGLILTWVLVRYDFPGRRLADAIIDLPFALPTAVAGIALTALYAPNGWIGHLLAPLGIKAAYNPVGIWIALVFVGLPFVVRSVQPVLQEFDAEVEEAAIVMGANPIQRWFGVILPTLYPSLLTEIGRAHV